MQKWFRIGFLWVLVCIISVSAAQDVTTAWTCPEGFEGQTLNVFNWATYIGENTISQFEKLCGVTVTYDVFDTNESLVARLRQGNPGYDVSFPNEYIVPVMIREGLVQPIDLEKIPNFANVAEKWQNPIYDPDNQYTVPYLWGTTGVGYNVEAVGGEITSWEQVFNHDGPVSWIADPRTMFPIALTVLGLDPLSTEPEDIEAAKTFLVEHSSNLVAVTADDGQAFLERGEVDIAIEYSGDIYQLIVDCECDTYAYAIPQEGSIADITNIVLLTDAPNPELAQVFMDYILDPVVNADITNYVLYATANQAAIDSGLIPEEVLTNTAIFPSEASLENLFFLTDIESEVQQRINAAWDELLIEIGQY